MESEKQGFFESVNDKKELKVIFITDYHLNEKMTEKLKTWYMDQKEFDIDLVIHGGDFDNLEIYEKGPDNPEYVFSEARISAHLKYLEFFGSKIYYVPGNHDPATLFYKSGEEEADCWPIVSNISCNTRAASWACAVLYARGNISPFKSFLKSISCSSLESLQHR